MISDLLFILATLMWCQKLDLRTLWLYAFAVALTAVLMTAYRRFM